MKKDITHTIVIVIFTGILLGAGVLGVVFWRLQEQNKAQFTRYLMRISLSARMNFTVSGI